MKLRRLDIASYVENPNQRVFLTNGAEVINLVPLLNSNKVIIALAGVLKTADGTESTHIWNRIVDNFAPKAAQHRFLMIQEYLPFPKLMRSIKQGYVILATAETGEYLQGVVLQTDRTFASNPELGYTSVSFVKTRFVEHETQELNIKF